jgi:U2-associated protein SR140
VARLHLICDILHNSAAPVPSAWKFRQEFQARLGIVFDHLANIYHSFPGRITADMFKKQITTVVDIWEDWIVFPPDFTSQLRRRLEGAKASEENIDQEEPAVQATNKGFVSRFKSSTFQLAAEPLASTYDDGDPMDVSSEDGNKGLVVDIDGDPVNYVDQDQMKNSDGEDIDGDPIGEDVDGDPINEDVDGEPIAEDVDGEPLGDDLDIDGIPVDDGIDGVPANIPSL